MAWKPDYVSSDQLKTYLNIKHNNDDVFLANWATAVSRNVDDFTCRQFGQTTLEDRSYTPEWDRHEFKTYVKIDDLQDTTGFVVKDSNGTTVTNYTLLPKNALVKGKPYERISITSRFSLDVVLSGKWGWSSVPPSVPTAAYIQASRIAARRGSPFGVAGSPTDGSEVRLLAMLDPDVLTTLQPVKRKWYIG